MCTVTFLPKGNDKYILTSNRDETPKRAALAPEAYVVGDTTIYFPKDPLAGGTWIATDKSRFTICLLNGGFEKHSHTPPYRLSRGQMVLQFFEHADLHSFTQTFEFGGMEPFTLVVVESTSQKVFLNQLVWDGLELHSKSLDADQTFIWSSSTLYPEPVRAERKSWFEQWTLNQQVFDQPTIMEFHKSGGKGDAWNDFVMNRNGVVQTVSITSIEKQDTGFNMIYEDLLKEKGVIDASS
ncbi:NRDE family protein [Roseivirga sp. E12]|uniref:NRDE family protein n=1 Tax=Roseivirga sp. E12 TaxID=2819237 RepID=UPI001ABCE847|nr:NRDE family protein [Roseivirga sp. E12]MBO3699282.1 NRDE family protein [Roseivirga sp. E12]